MISGMVGVFVKGKKKIMEFKEVQKEIKKLNNKFGRIKINSIEAVVKIDYDFEEKQTKKRSWLNNIQ